MEKLNFFCFRDILNRVIYDESFDRVGKLIDVYISKEKTYPRIIGYKVFKEREEFYYEFRSISFYKRNREIIMVVDGIFDILPQSYKCLLSKELLNKQVIDVNGKKVVRMMDFHMANISDEIRVVGVESGISSLLRKYRINSIPKILLKIINKCFINTVDTVINWEDVESFEFTKDSLTLSVSYQKISTMHPADIASIIEELDENNRKKLFESLDDNLASDILEQIEDTTIRVDLIKNLSDSKTISILNYLPNDELANILEDMDDTSKEKILINLEEEDIKEINTLLSYDHDIVGSFMNTDFISFNLNVKLGELVEIIRDMNPKQEEIYNIYVVDEDKVLKGDINFKNLLLNERYLNLFEVMDTKFIYLFDSDSLKEAFNKFLKYNLISIPVVNIRMQICGILFIHDILTKEFFKI